jgi:hypothetical protein
VSRYFFSIRWPDHVDGDQLGTSFRMMPPRSPTPLTSFESLNNATSMAIPE